MPNRRIPLEEEVGRNLKKIRENRGLTQAEFADAIGIERSGISKKEQWGKGKKGTAIELKHPESVFLSF